MSWVLEHKVCNSRNTRPGTMYMFHCCDCDDDFPLYESELVWIPDKENSNDSNVTTKKSEETVG